MSQNISGSIFETSSKIANGFVSTDKRNIKAIYLDVSQATGAYLKPAPIKIHPMVNNLTGSHGKDIVYQNIRPIFIVMRLLGVLPITRPKPGLTQFSVTSAAMLYSLIVYVCLVSYILYLSINKVQIFRSSEGKFEEAVIEYLFTVYLFPIIVIPIIWYETRKIANVLNTWAEFELTFRKVAQVPLQTNLLRKSSIISVVIPVLATSSVIVTHTTMVHFKANQIIPYVYLEILTYILGGYWYLLCETISESANVLADDFQQSLRNIGPAGKVAEYRGLWLRLSKLTRDTGIANCYSFTFVCLYLFVIITLSIYGLLSQISEGFGIKDIGLAVTTLCSISLLFFVCDEAHFASQNVRTNFQKKLLMVELTWMNTDAQTEVNMFLRATEMNPSHISLGGFFTVNRNLFKSLLATMVTYLVVLLQFQISIPDDSTPSIADNGTALDVVPTESTSPLVGVTSVAIRNNGLPI